MDNTYTENIAKESKPKAKEPTKKKRKSNRSLVNILSGDFLSEQTLVNNLPFVGFVGLLLIVLIGWH
jgi:hypothetical protein